MKLVKCCVLLSLFLSSCVPNHVTPNANPSTDSTNFSTAEDNGGQVEKTLESTKTVQPTATQTITSTPTEIIPALNRTAMPVISDVINPLNIDNLRVLKQTSSSNQVYLLDPDGLRYFINIETKGEVRDAKTNEILWRPTFLVNSQINHEGTQVISYLNSFSELQIQHEDGKEETFTIPAQTGQKTNRSFTYNYQKRLLAIEPRPSSWGRPTVTSEIYFLDTKEPVYSIKGNSLWFTWTGKYLYYKQGNLLVFADAETGKKINEFGIGESDNLRLSWDEELIGFSRNGVVEIWRIADRKMIRVIQIQKDYILDSNDFLFSKGNKALMVLHPDGIIRTWNIETGEIIQEEKSDLLTLDQLRVSDGGDIIKFEFPEFPGRSWEKDSYPQSEMYFSKGGDSIFFVNQTSDNFRTYIEDCSWDLLNSPKCNFHTDEFWASPDTNRLFGFGNDGEKYYLRSRVKPVTLHRGWEQDGEYITQLPEMSIKGIVQKFNYDPSTGILIARFNDGSVFLLNHNTNARLLLDTKFVNPSNKKLTPLSSNYNRYFFSKDGNHIFEIVNQKNTPSTLDFIIYDTQTLKETSRQNLGISQHPLSKNETGELILPLPISSTLSLDGKFLYVFVNYYSLIDAKKTYTSSLLTIPVGSPETAQIADIGRNSAVVSNILMTNKGDLLIYADTNAGDLYFIDPNTGKNLGNFHIGGQPTNLVISSDDNLLAVSDIKAGIKLLGIPEY